MVGRYPCLPLNEIHELISKFEDVLKTHHQNNGKEIKFRRSNGARGLFFDSSDAKYTIHLGCSKDTNRGVVPEREKTYYLTWGEVEKNHGYPYDKVFDKPEEVLNYLLTEFN